MDIDEFIDGFLQLPQPDFDPDGYPNHWHFSLQPIPGPMNRSVFFIINPFSRIGFKTAFLNLELCFNQMTLREVGREWLLLLMIAFARSTTTEMEVIRPRSWCTDSSVLQDVMEHAVKDFGIVSELPLVNLAEEHETQIATDAWAGVFRTLRAKLELA